MNFPSPWIDIALASTLPLSLLVILLNRRSAGKGIGIRTIQFVAVSMMIPATVLLALHGKLQGEAVAAILGALAGYLLSNIAKFEERDRGGG